MFKLHPANSQSVNETFVKLTNERRKKGEETPPPRSIPPIRCRGEFSFWQPRNSTGRRTQNKKELLEVTLWKNEQPQFFLIRNHFVNTWTEATCKGKPLPLTPPPKDRQPRRTLENEARMCWPKKGSITFGHFKPYCPTFHLIKRAAYKHLFCYRWKISLKFGSLLWEYSQHSLKTSIWSFEPDWWSHSHQATWRIIIFKLTALLWKSIIRFRYTVKPNHSSFQTYKSILTQLCSKALVTL